MKIPENLYYTNDHEWVRVDGDEAVFGITDYAQGELGDIVYLELPSALDDIKQGEQFGEIEAVKAAAKMYAPVSGKVIEVNEALEQEPELINQSPFENGWIVKVQLTDKAEVAKLLTSEAYKNLLEKPEGE